MADSMVKEEIVVEVGEHDFPFCSKQSAFNNKGNSVSRRKSHNRPTQMQEEEIIIGVNDWRIAAEKQRLEEEGISNDDVSSPPSRSRASKVKPFRTAIQTRQKTNENGSASTKNTSKAEDPDYNFCLSLYESFKRIPKNCKTKAKIELLEVLNQYEQISSTLK